MSMVYCDNCGATIEESARFCRACGKATPLSEATTRRFDDQPDLQTPTGPVGSPLTGPAYLAPFELPAASQTNDLRRKAQKRNVIIIVSMLAVMIFALAGLLFFLSSSSGGTAGIPVGPPGLEASPPQVPLVPPVPPAPPVPPGISGPSNVDQSLIYPGAQQTMSVIKEGGKSVLQLHSDDATAKVADWYAARLKTAKRFSIAGQTFLQAGDIHVAIVGGDSGAEIIITRDQNR